MRTFRGNRFIGLRVTVILSAEVWSDLDLFLFLVSVSWNVDKIMLRTFCGASVCLLSRYSHFIGRIWKCSEFKLSRSFLWCLNEVTITFRMFRGDRFIRILIIVHFVGQSLRCFDFIIFYPWFLNSKCRYDRVQNVWWFPVHLPSRYSHFVGRRLRWFGFVFIFSLLEVQM